MNGIRRALIWASAERYLGLLVNFGTLATVSRMLTPAEVGVSVIGIGIMTIAQSLREFATSEFLIQRAEVTREDARTAFTVLFGLTLAISAALLVQASWVAAFYGEPELSTFIRLIAVTNLLAATSLPITALLRRDMAFGDLAVINVATTLVNGGVTIGLAALGFSYLSFAWALLLASATTCILSLYFRSDFWIFRPLLTSWRSALSFGGYNGALTFLRNGFDSLPQLALARILPLPAIGLYNRALTISGIPDKFILAGIVAVAFPAFASGVREGRPLKQLYLRALSYITAVYWPAMILVALLARPLVEIILGPQWMEAVPLIRIMALASLFWFPSSLTFPVLAAVGAMRDSLIVNLITIPVSAAILVAACVLGGIEAMALSQFVTLPFQIYVSFRFVRRHVPFGWGDLLAALWRSAAAALCSAAAGGLAMVWMAEPAGPSFGAALLALGLAVFGWGIGLRLTRHPILTEIGRAAAAIGRRAAELGRSRKTSAAAPARGESW